MGTILSASELPMAVIMSTLVLHETVTFLQWVGVIIILGGIAYPNIQSHKTTHLIKKNV
ncbi:hypothetical protein MUB16_01810 [Priestia sp. OVL9]|nr:hypothetical protein [Priestia sp. OVL9]